LKIDGNKSLYHQVMATFDLHVVDACVTGEQGAHRAFIAVGLSVSTRTCPAATNSASDWRETLPNDGAHHFAFALRALREFQTKTAKAAVPTAATVVRT
jgi:hypothetical protein